MLQIAAQWQQAGQYISEDDLATPQQHTTKDAQSLSVSSSAPGTQVLIFLGIQIGYLDIHIFTTACDLPETVRHKESVKYASFVRRCMNSSSVALCVSALSVVTH